MSVPGIRIARFVRAARSLLLMQVAAAVVATALGLWAVLAVRGMAAERDELRAQVAELENRQPQAPVAAPAPTGPTPSPLDEEVRPPVILPVPIPVTETAPPPPDEPLPNEMPETPDPVTDTPGTTTTTPDGQDCSGENARLPRCRPGRPGRWNRGDTVPRRPLTPVRPEPQQPQRPTPQ